MTVTIKLEDLSEWDALDLVGYSNVLREEPRKKWTDKEMKEHIRYAVQRMVKEFLDKKKLTR
jgi:hypothetical protein